MNDKTCSNLKSKSISILTCFSIKNEGRVLDYFISHQSKMADTNLHKNDLTSFVYAGRFGAVLEWTNQGP